MASYFHWERIRSPDFNLKMIKYMQNTVCLEVIIDGLVYQCLIDYFLIDFFSVVLGHESSNQILSVICNSFHFLFFLSLRVGDLELFDTAVSLETWCQCLWVSEAHDDTQIVFEECCLINSCVVPKSNVKVHVQFVDIDSNLMTFYVEN